MAASAPWVEVSLDKAPRERWKAVVAQFDLATAIPALAEGFFASFADGGDEGKDRAFVAALADNVMRGLEGVGAGEYAEEMRGIAEACGVDVGLVVLLHLSYEAEAGCTAVVGRLRDGRTVLGRTLDWHLPELKPLTVNVRFTRGGRELYTATTWAGYVGVLTAQRPGALAVAINFRESGGEEEEEEDDDDEGGEEKDDRCDEFAWPVGFLVRHTVESVAGASYDEALRALAAAPLMSPTYIVLADGAACRGAVLTRDERGEARRAEAAGRGLLVQANMDWWERSKKKDTQESLVRVRLARRMLPKSGEVTVEAVWACLEADPIWEDGVTLYATVMVPSAVGGVYHTAVERGGGAAAGNGKKGKKQKPPRATGRSRRPAK